MQNIIKRLEIIKAGISVEDEEIIELQVKKLSDMDIDNDVHLILDSIKGNNYRQAILQIDQYISENSGIVTYIDEEVQGLKLELKVLEEKLQNLTEEKNEYLHSIKEFNAEYTLRLGSIIQEILNIKKEIYYYHFKQKEKEFEKAKSEFKSSKEKSDEFKQRKQQVEEELENLDPLSDEYDDLYKEYQNIREEIDNAEKEFNEKREQAKKAKKEFEESSEYKEYEDIKQDYEEFKKEFKGKSEKNIFELKEEEKSELKKIYREACRICHPDIVDAEFQEKATEIMQQLNEAYDKNDIKLVRQIHISLQNGVLFKYASDTIDDKELLKKKISEVRKKIKINLNEINNIKEDETFNLIQKIDDREEYFNHLKIDLEKELIAYKNEYKKIFS
jgi:hypothetical protein